MNEVKTPKKPLIYYYGIVMLVLMLFNFPAMPWFVQRQILKVDYGTFMEMTEQKQIGQVEVQDNQILFTNQEGTRIYKTGLMVDPDLIYRLKDSGANFSGEIIEQMSPFASFLLSWVLPIAIFVCLGQFAPRKMMEKAGGPNSMMFGKSNAKVYVKSSEGIKFSDVAGEDEAKENLTEIVDCLHNPDKYREIGAFMPKGILLVGLPGTQCLICVSLCKMVMYSRFWQKSRLVISVLISIRITGLKWSEFGLRVARFQNRQAFLMQTRNVCDREC